MAVSCPRSNPQLCPTLCNPIDYSPLGTSVHGIFPGKNTGVGCHSLLQGIFPTQGSNLGLLHWQVDSLPLSHQGSPTVGYRRGHDQNVYRQLSTAKWKEQVSELRASLIPSSTKRDNNSNHGRTEWCLAQGLVLSTWYTLATIIFHISLASCSFQD